MKSSSAMLLTSAIALAEQAIPKRDKAWELPDRKREDPKVKRVNKAAAKSRRINMRIRSKKRKFSRKRNNK